MKIFDENYIDIILGCDNVVRYNTDINSDYDRLYISYVGIDELLNFLKSDIGLIISEKVYNSNLKLIIVPTDSLCITDYNHYEILKIELFSNYNVKFFHSWYSNVKNFKIYFGIYIHKSIHNFICFQINNVNELTKKQKHFFTLNNKFNLYRKKLLEVYNNFPTEYKEKMTVSFNFSQLYFDNFQTIDEQYGNSINDLYNNSLIEIVTESSFCSISEKSYKPILAGVPFIYWYGNESVNFSYQIEYFKYIGIDINYFNIDYSNSNSVIEKINEILNLSINEVIEKFEMEFIKAENNKKKIIDYINKLKLDIE